MVRRNNSQRDDDEDSGADIAPTAETNRGWANDTHQPTDHAIIETGRGNAVNVDAGAPFQPTIERIADEANYGGYFRVFLNGEEIVDPATAPQTIEAGQRITITPYDKVGVSDCLAF